MTESEDKSRSARLTALKSAVVTLLRPLIGLLIEYGLTYPWLSDTLKRVFVDVADREFRLADKRQTDSRITLLTGIHRKDVRRLRHSGEPQDEAPPASVYLGAQLVAVWTSDPRFVDARGHPRALPRLAKNGAPGFDELVTSVSKDIRPRAVLDEWLRLGAVEIDAQQRVRLQTDAFVPAKGFEEKAYYLGRNVHDHVAAARHNVRGAAPPLLERSVYYEDLSADSVRELDEMARREGSRLLQRLNRRARTLQAADRRAGTGRRRVNFGLYFFTAAQDPESDGGADGDD